MKIPSNKIETLRKFPNAQHDFMRFQYGFFQMAPVLNPESGRHLCDFPFFHLCGHGSTLEKAARMAGVKLAKEVAI